MLSFLEQEFGPEVDWKVYKKLRNQIWFGTLLGFFICLVIGCALIGTFYGIGLDRWAPFEYIWEGVFAIIASIIIALMGVALLRVSKMQEKWRVKLAKALEAKDTTPTKFSKRFQAWAEKYIMFLLPFITIMREGIEAVVFIGGVTIAVPASAIPLPTVCGLLAGSAVGYIIYKAGNIAPVKIFLIISTCFLYLVAAALFSRGVWYLEADAWNKATGGDASENGAGPGSYDISKSVWHVNCCSPTYNGGGGWGVFNAILGWQNSATYGSVISYNVFWLAVILGLSLLRFKETRGYYPFMKSTSTSLPNVHGLGNADGQDELNDTHENLDGPSTRKTIQNSESIEIGSCA